MAKFRPVLFVSYNNAIGTSAVAARVDTTLKAIMQGSILADRTTPAGNPQTIALASVICTYTNG
jgi:hypothetical protein